LISRVSVLLGMFGRKCFEDSTCDLDHLVR
jgi:hypothetical protein